MESRIISVYDYNKVNLAAFQQPFHVDKEKIDREILHLQNRYTKWVTGDVVGEGDMALCSLKSDYQRFQKPKVKVLVGSGLLDRKLEQSLVGIKNGEPNTVTLQHNSQEVKVEVTVLEVTNKLIEPLKDDMTQELGIPGVETIQQYREYLTQQQKKAFIEEIEYPAIQFVRKEVMKQSQMVLKQEDWEQVVRMEEGRIRVLASKEGLKLETMTAKDFEGKIPVASYHELLVSLQQCAWESLSEHLLGIYYAKEEGYQPDQKAYDTYLKEYMQFWHETREMSEKINPYEYYIFQEYKNYFFGKVRDYVHANILI